MVEGTDIEDPTLWCACFGLSCVSPQRVIDCFARVKPWVQTPVPLKKKKKKGYWTRFLGYLWMLPHLEKRSLQMKWSHWNTVSPNPVTGVLIIRGKFRHRENSLWEHQIRGAPKGRRPCRDGGSWSDTTRSQGTPRIAVPHQKLEEVGRVP
jgi:hypothetical protein